jgi:hypothetical protein
MNQYPIEVLCYFAGIVDGEGYRHHDGCVSYVLDSGKSGGCGYAIPGILKDEEMEYFKSHPEDFAAYCNLSDRVYNGEKAPMAEMQAALLR